MMVTDYLRELFRSNRLPPGMTKFIEQTYPEEATFARMEERLNSHTLSEEDVDIIVNSDKLRRNLQVFAQALNMPVRKFVREVVTYKHINEELSCDLSNIETVFDKVCKRLKQISGPVCNIDVLCIAIFSVYGFAQPDTKLYPSFLESKAMSMFPPDVHAIMSAPAMKSDEVVKFVADVVDKALSPELLQRTTNLALDNGNIFFFKSIQSQGADIVRAVQDADFEKIVKRRSIYEDDGIVFQGSDSDDDDVDMGVRRFAQTSEVCMEPTMDDDDIVLTVQCMFDGLENPPPPFTDDQVRQACADVTLITSWVMPNFMGQKDFDDERFIVACWVADVFGPNVAAENLVGYVTTAFKYS